jgi:hypothetical protein
MKTPDFAKARADYHRVAATCDRAWDNYRKARERLAKHKGRFSAEQGFIDASQAVGRAALALDEKETLLRSASFHMADRELTGAARARVPFQAPTLADKRARMEEIVTAAMLSTGA